MISARAPTKIDTLTAPAPAACSFEREPEVLLAEVHGDGS
jgi:hypothetical protein